MTNRKPNQQRVQSTRTKLEIVTLGSLVVRTDEQSSVKPGDPARVATRDGQVLAGTVSLVHLDGLSCLMSAHIHIDVDPTEETP